MEHTHNSSRSSPIKNTVQVFTPYIPVIHTDRKGIIGAGQLDSTSGMDDRVKHVEHRRCVAVRRFAGEVNQPRIRIRHGADSFIALVLKSSDPPPCVALDIISQRFLGTLDLEDKKCLFIRGKRCRKVVLEQAVGESRPCWCGAGPRDGEIQANELWNTNERLFTTYARQNVELIDCPGDCWEGNENRAVERCLRLDKCEPLCGKEIE